MTAPFAPTWLHVRQQLLMAVWLDPFVAIGNP